jgi:hypothetical protein
MLLGMIALSVLLALGCVYLLILWLREQRKSNETHKQFDIFQSQTQGKFRQAETQFQELRAANTRLSKYSNIADADDAAARLNLDIATRRREAELSVQSLLEQGNTRANDTLLEAKRKAKELSERAELALTTANINAKQIVDQAELRAQETSSRAFEVMQNIEQYERTAQAMKNLVDGYGDRYLVPPQSILDELSDAYSHKEAGQRLKEARKFTEELVITQSAAECDYAEVGRRVGAERFVIDAFNGKVDSILSRVKHDNAGTLRQEVTDAFAMVNHGGRAFRNARITQGYLDARLAELRWASAAQLLRKQEVEEQRQIREQLREEEKVRREVERAIRESEREEESLRKAMEKAQAMMQSATLQQREKYESQLAELSAKLLIAEEKNKRALSMAQQTKRGHVYVISNVGSFGDGLLKIGMTRRLDPMDRIWELSDASVPFDFDVHAMIMCEDAPQLERLLHKSFLLGQVNKVNHRKEFFRVTIAELREALEKQGISASWTMAAEAREYRETLAIERMIESDPNAREAWLNRQLMLDPVSVERDLTAVSADDED